MECLVSMLTCAGRYKRWIDDTALLILPDSFQITASSLDIQIFLINVNDNRKCTILNNHSLGGE
jgi:hypothetical protein